MTAYEGKYRAHQLRDFFMSAPQGDTESLNNTICEALKMIGNLQREVHNLSDQVDYLERKLARMERKS